MKRKAFTLVEMLIVIVIIGILASALIPKITGVQQKARDVARTQDIRDIDNAIKIYSADNNGSYPDDGLGNSIAQRFGYRQLLASLDGTTLATNTTTPTPGTIEILQNTIGNYISEIPNDPTQNGIVATASGGCNESGSTYAYKTWDDGSKYAITANMEGAGDTASCDGTITGSGGYKSTGVGLVYVASSGGGFNPASDDPVDRCVENMTDAEYAERENTMEPRAISGKENLCGRTALEFVDWNTQLGKNIPNSIGKIKNLQYITIYYGYQIYHVPGSIASLPNIKDVSIQVIDANAGLGIDPAVCSMDSTILNFFPSSDQNILCPTN